MTREDLNYVLHTILACEDARYIKEIYAKSETFDIHNELTRSVHLMVVTALDFNNHDLYDTLDDFEEIYDKLVVSVEPDDAERGHGTILWSMS